jgi:hypothetical protein
LNKQCISSVLWNTTTTNRRAAMFRQLPRNRLNHVKDPRNIFLVVLPNTNRHVDR